MSNYCYYYLRLVAQWTRMTVMHPQHLLFKSEAIISPLYPNISFASPVPALRKPPLYMMYDIDLTAILKWFHQETSMISIFWSIPGQIWSEKAL